MANFVATNFFSVCTVFDRLLTSFFNFRVI